MDYGGFSPKYSQKLCYNSFKRGYLPAFGLCCCCFTFPLTVLSFMASSSQRKYKYKLCDAVQVNEETQGWTVIVQVLIKYPTKPAQNNPNLLYKKFLLTDMKGTLVSAITFTAMDHFDRVFEPFKRYYVTCAAVRVAEPKYKVGDYNYTWTLYPRTHVQPVDDLKPYICPYSFDCIKFSEMFRVADRNVSVAVQGLIVHSISTPTTKNPLAKDYVLVNQEKRPMLLRVWTDVLNEDETEVTKKLPAPTFVTATELKVTTYNGLSLTTGYEPHFMVNPPLREMEPLLAWYNEHVEEVKQMIQEKAYTSTNVLLPPPAVADFVPIKEVLKSMATLKTAWVKGTIHMLPAQTKLWHNVCDKCKKTVNLPVGSDLPCAFCNEDMNVEPRSCLHVFLNDPSGTLSATLFSSVAEKFIGYTAMELFEAAEKGAPLNDEIAKKIDKKEVMCFLKDYDRKYEGRFERSFPVIRICVEEDGGSTNMQLPSKLVDDTVETVAEVCASSVAEKEKQPFSPTIKGVVEQIATKVGVPHESSLTSGLVKRSMTFNEFATEEEDTVGVDKIASPSHEKGKNSSGSESPVKKLKNVVRHE